MLYIFGCLCHCQGGNCTKVWCAVSRKIFECQKVDWTAISMWMKEHTILKVFSVLYFSHSTIWLWNSSVFSKRWRKTPTTHYLKSNADAITCIALRCSILRLWENTNRTLYKLIFFGRKCVTIWIKILSTEFINFLLHVLMFLFRWEIQTCVSL